jgi:hypothetical protein
MASAKYRKTYHSRRPLKIFIRALLITIAALIVIAVCIFFGFRKYIVYTPGGVRLDIPILREDTDVTDPTDSGVEVTVTIE